VLRWQAHSHVWGGTREINKKSTSRLFETGCIHVWDSVVQCPSAPSSFSWNALWSWTNAHALHQNQHQQNKKLKKTFKLTPPPQLPGLLTMPVPLAMVYHSNHVWVASDPIILCFDPYVFAPPLSSLRSQSSPQSPSMFCLTQPCTPPTDASVQGLLGLQGRGEDHDNRREGDLVGLDKHAHQSLEPTRGEHSPSLSLSLSAPAPMLFVGSCARGISSTHNASTCTEGRRLRGDARGSQRRGAQLLYKRHECVELRMGQTGLPLGCAGAYHIPPSTMS
jgi:hypothetical protein